MELSKIFKQLLIEQLPPQPMGQAPMMAPPSPMSQPPLGGNLSPTTQGGPPQEGANIVELADVNTFISLFPAEKKLVFSMQEHSSMTKKLKLYVDVLKQNFMISSIKKLDESVFEMVLDPREDFNSVIQFLQPQMLK